jgi:hypothetical protein
VPYLLIGSPHASVIEGQRQLLEGGEGKPVAVYAKLGWCIYGGNPDLCDNYSYSIQSVNASDSLIRAPLRTETISNEKLFDLYTFFNSIENLGILKSSVHRTEDEI